MRFSVEAEREIYTKWSQDSSRYSADNQEAKQNHQTARDIYKALIKGDYKSEYQYFRAIAYEPAEVKEAFNKLCGIKDPRSYIKHPVAFKHTIDHETYEHYKLVTHDIDYVSSSKLYDLYQELEAAEGVPHSAISHSMFGASILSINAKASPGWGFDCDAMIGIPVAEVTKTLQDLKNYCQSYNRKISKQHGLLVCTIGTLTIYFYTDTFDEAMSAPILLPKTLASIYLGAIERKLNNIELNRIDALTQSYFEKVFTNTSQIDIQNRLYIIQNSEHYMRSFLEDHILYEQAKSIDEDLSAKILLVILSSNTTYQEFTALYQSLNPVEQFAYKRIAKKYQLNRKLPKLKNYHLRPERTVAAKVYKHSKDQACELRDKFLAKLDTIDIFTSGETSQELDKHKLKQTLVHETYSSYFCENLSCLIQLDDSLDDASLVYLAILIKTEHLTLVDRNLLCFELYTDKGPLEIFIIFGDGIQSVYQERSVVDGSAYDYYYTERTHESLEARLRSLLIDNSNQACALISELDASSGLDLKTILDGDEELVESLVKTMHSSYVTEDTTNQINLHENQRIFSKLSQGDVVTATGKRHKRFNKIYSNLLWHLERYTQKFELLVSLGDKYGFAMGAFITMPRTVHESEFIEALALLVKEHDYELITISGCLALKKKGCIFYCMYSPNADISAYVFCQTQMEAMLNSRRKLVGWQPSANLTKILMDAKA
jgi:hypothetical protein